MPEMSAQRVEKPYPQSWNEEDQTVDFYEKRPVEHALATEQQKKVGRHRLLVAQLLLLLQLKPPSTCDIMYQHQTFEINARARTRHHTRSQINLLPDLDAIFL